MSCFIPKIQAVKFAAKLQSRRKKVVFGLPICRGGYTPDFRHAFSNRTSEHVANFSRVPFNELGE